MDIITYTKKIIESLNENNFFDQPFMDPDVLSLEILKIVSSNIENGLVEPKLTESQFREAIEKTKTIIVDKTLNELLDKDLVKIIGMNENGELLYSLNQEK
jgi:hypothetical protein